MTTQTKAQWQSLLHPRHWPTWFGLGIFWCLAQLPFSLQTRIGSALGMLMYAISERRRHIADINLKLCFPELDNAKRKLLLKQHFKSMGMSFLEVVSGWWLSERRLKNRVQIHGLEHLQTALDQGNGVILLSAHFTCLEIGGRLLSLFAPFHVMYRSHENPVIEFAMRNNRELHFDKAIPRDNVREMIKSLRHGKAVWYASDQNYGHKNSVFADFFGVPAATNTATSRLAKITGATVIPFFPIRNTAGTGYTLQLLPALENFPSDETISDASRINQLIAEQIRKAPEQYLWVHRRFKDRPEGQKSVYD